MNDGSKDGSLDVLKSLARERSDINIIDQANQGAAVARNKGLEAMTGDAFMF